MKQLNKKIVLSEGCAIKEAHLDHTETVAEFEMFGNKYLVEGQKSHTRDYNWEEIYIYENKYDCVGYGKDKWLNRPWYRFTFANALRSAVINWLGTQAKEKIDRAIESSSSCQEAMDKFVELWNAKSDKPIQEGANKEVFVVDGYDKDNDEYIELFTAKTKEEAIQFCKDNLEKLKNDEIKNGDEPCDWFVIDHMVDDEMVDYEPWTGGEIKESLSEDDLRTKVEELGIDKLSELIDKYSSCANQGECNKVGRTALHIMSTNRDKIDRELYKELLHYFGFHTNESIKESAEELPDALPEEPIVVEDEVDTQKEDVDGGVASVINAILIDEFEAIEEYNNAISTVKSIMDNTGIDYTDVLKVFNDVVGEENIHVGQLQEVLKTVSESAKKIDDGKEEATIDDEVEDTSKEVVDDEEEKEE